MENKIYQECREEAYQIIKNSMVHSLEELNQLTAELYAQKFADWIHLHDLDTDSIFVNSEGKWGTYHNTIGTTAQLHSKFVEENKGGENENH
jgi:hypothetical protein